MLHKAGFIDAPHLGKGSHVALYKEKEGRMHLVIIPKTTDTSQGDLARYSRSSRVDTGGVPESIERITVVGMNHRISMQRD